MSDPYKYDGYTFDSADANVNVSFKTNSIGDGSMIKLDFSNKENEIETDGVKITMNISNANLMNFHRYYDYNVFVPVLPSTADRVVRVSDNTMVIPSTCKWSFLCFLT